MTTSEEQFEATAQLDRARAALGEALGQTQDITNSGIDVEQVSQSLAKAVKGIFTIQHQGLDQPGSLHHIEGAMDHLRQTLQLLQDLQGQDPSLSLVTSTVARILALIYPVSKLVENLTSNSPHIALPRQSESHSPKDGERRISDRRSIEVDIGVQSDTNFFTGFSQDISSGGLFIATYDVLKMGTELNVNFRLPGGPVLSLNATVCWLREYNETTPDISPGMGVRFNNLSAADEEAINQFIAANPPIFYDAD